MSAKNKKSDALIGASSVVMAPVGDLLPYAANARTHSADQVKRIAASIREFGFNNPILIDGEKGIIAGHGRLAAAKKLGLAEVPTIELAHLTDAQKRAYILADNRLALDAGWDDAMLGAELKRLQEDAFDLGLTGFSQEELDKLLGDAIAPTDGLTDEDEVPEDVPAICQRGQVWKLGRHRLMCGDSTSADEEQRLLSGAKVDMVFTDPPYGMRLDTNYKSMSTGAKAFVGNEYRPVIGDDVDFDPSWIIERFKGVREIFLWGADYFHDSLPRGGSFVVWDKRIDELASAPGNEFELCWSREHHKRAVYRKLWCGVTAKERTEVRVHPTQKPIALAEWFFERWGKEGESVLDLFGGSGSTLIACEKTGRTCFMMELDEKYCDVIIARWEAFTGQKAELLP